MEDWCYALNTFSVSKNNNYQQLPIISSNNYYWNQFLSIIVNYCFSKSQKEAKEQKKPKRRKGFLVGYCEDVALVEVFFCVKRHIIIFKEEVGEVVIDASTCELDNGFLLCPKTSEGDLRIGS